MKNSEAWEWIIEWQYEAREVVQVWPNDGPPAHRMKRIDEIVTIGPLAYRGCEILETAFVEVGDLRGKIVAEFAAWAKQIPSPDERKHPWYGPCDSFGANDECHGCREVDAGCYDEGWYNEEKLDDGIDYSDECQTCNGSGRSGATTCHACCGSGRWE
jgi:hypothetical protein